MLRAWLGAGAARLLSLLMLSAVAAPSMREPVRAGACVDAARRRSAGAAPGTAAADPAYVALDSAYGALRRRDWDAAVACFAAASSFAPNRTDVRKNLAYTYFKTGRNDLAREQFAAVVALDPADWSAALELAFLDYEQPDHDARREAHALFRRLRSAPDSGVRARAAAAFANVDRALADRIGQLRGARRGNESSSVLLVELAGALEERGELAEAETLYRRVLEVDPGRAGTYLDLARVLTAAGRRDDARAMLRAAAASPDPYINEPARDGLTAPSRDTASLGLGAVAPALAGAVPRGFAVPGPAASGGWGAALAASGFPRVAPEAAGILVVPAGASDQAARPDWLAAARDGAVVIVSGWSPALAGLGMAVAGDSVEVRREQDAHAPRSLVLWREVARVPRVRLPASATVFSRERWSGAPLLAAVRVGRGAVLWSAVDPGARGFERLPYAAAALADLGVRAPLAARGMHAFFDYSYRSRADVEYLAREWRAMGISTLYVAAWHFMTPDAGRDAYLRALTDACHRNGILVYAWLELPHVSQEFWDAHPEWREKNGLLQDATVFWRRLMNLADPASFAAARDAVTDVLGRFDWDGANLSELYFEGLRGVSDLSHMTPFNDDVRREVRERFGFDPASLFDRASPAYYARDPAKLRRFLDYRVELQLRLHRQWLGVLDEVRRRKGSFAIVVCYVDDVSEPSMRDMIGADVRRLLPLVREYGATLLVQDPFVLWPLGPERYERIAADYRRVTDDPRRLAIDINIVAREAHAFPTDHQSGTELFQLVNTAQRAFPTVSLYAEHSVLPVDRPLLASALGVVDAFERRDSTGAVTLDAPRGVGLRWRGPALVDGRPWPWQDSVTVWLPTGRHAVATAPAPPHTRLVDFTGDLRAVALTAGGLTLAYRSDARAIAIVDRAPLSVTVDGRPATPPRLQDGARTVLLLPAGEHAVEIVTRR